MRVDIVRPSQRESLVDLLFELHACYNDPPTATRSDVRAHLFDNLLRNDSGLRLIVAASEGTVVLGFAAVALLYSLVEPGPKHRRQCLLKELYVRSSDRGRGIGRALVLRAAQYAVENGCGRMDWNVKASNLRGIEFYEDLGAVKVEDRLSFRFDHATLAQLSSHRAS